MCKLRRSRGREPSYPDFQALSVFAVEGGAGCGKTYQLMAALAVDLQERPLALGQRVLALTFMHGARRRLYERLRDVPGLVGRFESMTIDSFAWRLNRRWRGLATEIGIPPLSEDQYDEQCEAAAQLLQRPEVRNWIVTGFPVVLIDEAQDLKPERVGMVRALSQGARLLVAADEFQCLDPGLRPNPLVEWLGQVCESMVLNEPRRTNVPELLNAATSIRNGAPPEAGRYFRVLTSRGPYMSAAYLANAIAWRRDAGNVAVITPSRQGGFANSTIGRVCQHACGRHGNGPYPIHWERSDESELSALLAPLEFDADLNLDATLASLHGLQQTSPIKAARTWALYQARATGKTMFTRNEIEQVIAREVSLRRQRFAATKRRFSAMTVQQAKNREFDGVVVLWPFQIGGDSEHKRRLLYNAVTRARNWCTVILQGEAIGQAAPFV